MSNRSCLSLIVATFLAPAFSHAAVTPEAVDASIDHGKTWLYSRRKGDVWDKPDRPSDADMKRIGYTVNLGQWGGLTALSCYALLAAGESAQGARLAPAIKWLDHADIKGNYALSMKAQLYHYLPSTSAVRHAAQRDADLFQQGMSHGDKNGGLYDYLDDPKFTRVDHSVSQYCVLGMWSCEQAGAQVDRKYWADVEAAWVRDQQGGGGWCYQKTATEHYPIDASMTAAGVATLFITQDYLHADAGVKCVGNISSPPIDAGLKWMTDNFQRVFTDKAQLSPYYALYGVERIGLASGYKYFGTTDWYRTGTEYLLTHQSDDGSWGSVQSTCFALLFLSRGRAPIVFNKLQYESGSKIGNWNERPRDAANATRFISRSTERDLNWQIINLHVDERELHEAPVLLITGNQPLDLGPDSEAKLKRYCEEGGIILGNADGGSLPFAASFRKLAKKLFPDYAMRSLPADSPILRGEQYPANRWKQPVAVQSLSNGVREMMLLLADGDAAKWWQLNDTSKVSAFQFVDDLFLYAVDKQNLLERGKTYQVDVDAKLAPTRTVRVARLQYDGNWDPEPAGWPRLAAILHNTADINLVTTVVKLGDNKLDAGIRIAHLTGTTKLKLSPVQRQELHDFVTGGGTLIVDAAGGSAPFADSAEQQLAIIFGNDAAAQLKNVMPATSAVYHVPGGTIDAFGYRQYARSMLGSFKGPQLRAIEMDGRPAVYFSRLDLSAGLVGQPVDGIMGYDPDTAVSIVRNLVAMGLGQTASVRPTGAGEAK